MKRTYKLVSECSWTGTQKKTIYPNSPAVFFNNHSFRKNSIFHRTLSMKLLTRIGGAYQNEDFTQKSTPTNAIGTVGSPLSCITYNFLEDWHHWNDPSFPLKFARNVMHNMAGGAFAQL